MSNSQSLLAYPDVKEAFDRVLLGRGIRLVFKDRRAATRFVARCNAYRLLDRKENALLYEAASTMHGRSVYDPFRITRDGPAVTIQTISLEVESITELDGPSEEGVQQ